MDMPTKSSDLVASQCYFIYWILINWLRMYGLFLIWGRCHLVNQYYIFLFYWSFIFLKVWERFCECSPFPLSCSVFMAYKYWEVFASEGNGINSCCDSFCRLKMCCTFLPENKFRKLFCQGKLTSKMYTLYYKLRRRWTSLSASYASWKLVNMKLPETEITRLRRDFSNFVLGSSRVS